MENNLKHYQDVRVQLSIELVIHTGIFADLQFICVFVRFFLCVCLCVVPFMTPESKAIPREETYLYTLP